jgi:hypothetical protein
MSRTPEQDAGDEKPAEHEEDPHAGRSPEKSLVGQEVARKKDQADGQTRRNASSWAMCGRIPRSPRLPAASGCRKVQTSPWRLIAGEPNRKWNSILLPFFSRKTHPTSAGHDLRRATRDAHLHRHQRRRYYLRKLSTQTAPDHSFFDRRIPPTQIGSRTRSVTRRGSAGGNKK